MREAWSAAADTKKQALTGLKLGYKWDKVAAGTELCAGWGQLQLGVGGKPYQHRSMRGTCIPYMPA